MTEFKIYGIILAVLFIGLFFYLLPRAIYLQTKHAKNDEELETPLIETGVPTSWVNIADALALVVFFGLFSYSWWLQKPDGEDDSMLATEVIDKEVLLANLCGQVFVILIIMAIIAWRVSIPRQFGLSLKGNWRALVWVPIVLAVSWAFTAALMGLGYFEFLKEIQGESPLQESVLFLKESQDPILLTLMVLVACIGAPISEEVLFRGYIFPAVKGFSNAWFGIVFSGIMFAVIHYNLASIPTLLIMGCLLALSYEKTKSLWIPILIHLIFNTTTTVIQILSRYNPALSPEI